MGLFSRKAKAEPINREEFGLEPWGPRHLSAARYLDHLDRDKHRPAVRELITSAYSGAVLDPFGVNLRHFPMPESEALWDGVRVLRNFDYNHGQYMRAERFFVDMGYGDARDFARVIHSIKNSAAVLHEAAKTFDRTGWRSVDERIDYARACRSIAPLLAGRFPREHEAIIAAANRADPESLIEPGELDCVGVEIVRDVLRDSLGTLDRETRRYLDDLRSQSG